MQNENQTGITALEWDPSKSGHVMFADRDGYVGVFDVTAEIANSDRDPVAEDSLLMEVHTLTHTLTHASTHTPPPPPPHTHAHTGQKIT